MAGQAEKKASVSTAASGEFVVLERVDGGQWTVDGQLCADTMLWFRFRGNKTGMNYFGFLRRR